MSKPKSHLPLYCRECRSYRDTAIYAGFRAEPYNCAEHKCMVAPGGKPCGSGRRKGLPKTDQKGLF
jgi:hypothetical protein